MFRSLSVTSATGGSVWGTRLCFACLPAEAALHSNAYQGSLGSYQLWLQPELLLEDRNPTRAVWDCPVLCSGYPEMLLLVQCCCPSMAATLAFSLFSSAAFCGWKFGCSMTIYPYFSHALLMKERLQQQWRSYSQACGLGTNLIACVGWIYNCVEISCSNETILTF